MVESRRSFRPGRFLLAAMLALALLVMAGGPPASAARSICRSDPIVVLSDGSVVTMYADIEADLSEIANVHYELHVPAGLSVVSVVHPDPLTAHLETFYFADDADKNEFQGSTLVTTSSGQKVKATAYMDVVSQLKLKTSSVKKNGDSSRPIEVAVKLPKAGK